MDQLQTRLDALEQQMHAMNRRLHWWRGLACGLAVLAGLTWALPSGTAQEDARDRGPKGLAQRVAALEELLKHVSREGKEIFITGANLHIVNGLERTDCGSEEEPIPDCPNGLGNLIVGYNEPRGLAGVVDAIDEGQRRPWDVELGEGAVLEEKPALNIPPIAHEADDLPRLIDPVWEGPEIPERCI
jgi:hypothetical protein